MKFLILIHSNPNSRAVWETLTEEQRNAFGQAHIEIGERIEAAGELITSEGLQDVDAGKRVTIRDGQTVVTDGPFTEVKEYLAGYYLVDTPTIERAIEWAAQMPDALNGEVEVRPVFDLSTIDL